MTIRTRTAILGLLPDNTSGDIGAIDARDFADSSVPLFYAANVSGAVVHNFNNGNVAELTLTANITSFAITNGVAGQQLILTFVQGGAGGFTLAGSGGILWEGSSAPTLTATTGRRDVFRLYYNGTNWVEFGSAQNVS